MKIKKKKKNENKFCLRFFTTCAALPKVLVSYILSIGFIQILGPDFSIRDGTAVVMYIVNGSVVSHHYGGP